MFTRSGKRIYSCFYENSLAADMEPAVQSERKTRSSRRLKENVSELNVSLFKEKKRSNYVSYPTDDEHDDEKVASDDSEVKHGRILRKNTLKELNIATENTEHFTEPKNLRKSRRGKKNIEHILEDTREAGNIEDENLINIEKDKSKKYKKKKMSTLVDKIEVQNIKPKNKKKGKKSNKVVIEELNQRSSVTINKSMSIDSFHSAAGSLDGLIDSDAVEPAFEKADTTFDKGLNNTKKEINDNALDHDVSSKISSSFVNDFNNSVPIIKRKDATFDKSNSSITNYITNNIEQDGQSITSGSSTNGIVKAPSSNIHNDTYDMPSNIIDTTFEKAITHNSNSTYEKINYTINTTFDCTPNKKKESSVKDKSLDKNNDTAIKNDTAIITVGSSGKKGLTRKIVDKSNLSEDEIVPSSAKKHVFKNSSIIDVSSNEIDDCVYEHCQTKNFMLSKSSINDATFSEILFEEINKEYSNSANKKSRSDKHQKENASEKCNSTYDKEPASTFEYDSTNLIKCQSKFSLDNQVPQLDATYDKDNLRSSLLSSDNSEINKSDILRISITTDDSTENIVNAIPELIESSIDESCMSKQSTAPQTPLKRESTFTKESSEVQGVETPPKQNLPSIISAAGCTPYHISNCSRTSRLNITRSLEKNDLSMEPTLKTTKVMFCSPVDNPAAMVSEKKKIIKSNLKGSNKSFVFEDKAACVPRRKRSYTQNDAEDARSKRKRLAADTQQSLDRLSRSRTNSASAKLFGSTTPSKNPVTPSKSQDQPKPVRTRLPNFAALHQRQFAKMESLGECQERRARRAKQLLTPTGALDVLNRISPSNTTDLPKPKESVKKTETPTKQPTLESLRPGLNRFGFKLNLDRNPFSVPAKQSQPKTDIALVRQGTLPSLSGVTSVRRQAAKQMVMREKSFTDKRNLLNRNENRTFIKGVRTNRRFELQMKMRKLE